MTPGWLKNGWRVLAAIEGSGSPEAPSIYLDESHYVPHPTCPWWDLYAPNYHAMGVKHIIGSYLVGWSGNPAVAVSLDQYIYESAINSDGTWTWFDSPLRADEYRVFRSANRRIATVESRVGEYLLDGQSDFAFTCVVEQSGNSLLGEKVLQRTYHLKDSHLVHVSNGNIFSPVTVTVRLPRLSEGTTWTVRDPISGVHFLRSGKKPLWSDEELSGGISLDLERRSDAWLLLEPGPTESGIHPVVGIVAEPIRNDPQRSETAEAFPEMSRVARGSRLVYLNSRTENESTYPYYSTVRTAAHVLDMATKTDSALFTAKGNCWSATWSPDGGLVALSYYVSGKGQIYVMAADGSGVYNASKNGFCDHSPSWSPDGKRIAFVSDRDGDWEIYVMNADGSDEIRLTTSPGIDRVPRWSPDGERIAFESERDGGYDIWMMNADGSGQRPLVRKPGNEREPVWSQDGKKIACTFQLVGDRRSVLTADVNNGTSRLFFAPWGIRYTRISSLSWSPDGRRLAGAFQGGKNTADNIRSGVFVINADGSRQQEIVSSDPRQPRTGGERNGKMGGAARLCGWRPASRHPRRRVSRSATSWNYGSRKD